MAACWLAVYVALGAAKGTTNNPPPKTHVKFGRGFTHTVVGVDDQRQETGAWHAAQFNACTTPCTQAKGRMHDALAAPASAPGHARLDGLQSSAIELSAPTLAAFYKPPAVICKRMRTRARMAAAGMRCR